MSSPSRTRIIRRSSPSSFAEAQTPRPASTFTQFEEESDDDYFPDDFVPPPERSTPLSVNRQLRPNEAVFIPATASTSPSRSVSSTPVDEVDSSDGFASPSRSTRAPSPVRSTPTDGFASPSRSTRSPSPVRSTPTGVFVSPSRSTRAPSPARSTPTDGFASPSRSTRASSPVRPSSFADEIDEDMPAPLAGAVATPLVSVPSRTPATSPVIVEERSLSPRRSVASPAATMSPRTATMSPRTATMSPRTATMSPRTATMSPRRSVASPAATVVASYLPEPTFGQPVTLQEVLASRGLTPIASYKVAGLDDSVMVAVETETGSPATIQIPEEIFEELTNTEDEVLQPYEMEAIEDYEDREGEHENDEDDVNIVARSLRDINASGVCIPTSSGVCISANDQITPYVVRSPNARVSSFVGSDIPQPIISYDEVSKPNVAEEIDTLSAQLTSDKYQRAVAKLDKISELSETVNNYIQKKIMTIKRKLLENDAKQYEAVNKLNNIYAALAEYLDNQDIEDLKEEAKDARHKFGRLLRIAKYLEPLVDRYEDLIEKLQVIRETMNQEMGPFDE